MTVPGLGQRLDHRCLTLSGLTFPGTPFRLGKRAMTTPFDLMFRARCEARARLWQAGELTLHEAVDELERWARDRLDTDSAQAIMAAAFAAVQPKPNPAPGGHSGGTQ